MTEHRIIERLMNLHDVFLNANLQRACMESSPLVKDVNEYHFSDRARFERVWTTFLYVLVEAWQSDQMEPIREYLSSILNYTDLESTISRLESQGDLARMREIRNYMCHRDKRKYWNQGRLPFANMLHKNRELHDRFGKTLLDALSLLDTT